MQSLKNLRKLLLKLLISEIVFVVSRQFSVFYYCYFIIFPPVSHQFGSEEPKRDWNIQRDKYFNVVLQTVVLDKTLTRSAQIDR